MRKRTLVLTSLIAFILIVIAGTSPARADSGPPPGTAWSQDWDTSVVPPGDTISDITAITSGGLLFSGAATDISALGWTSTLSDPMDLLLSGPGTAGTFDFTLNFASLMGSGGSITLTYDIGSATYWETYTDTSNSWVYDSSGDPPKSMSEPGEFALLAVSLGLLMVLCTRKKLLSQRMQSSP